MEYCWLLQGQSSHPQVSLELQPIQVLGIFREGCISPSVREWLRSIVCQPSNQLVHTPVIIFSDQPSYPSSPLLPKLLAVRSHQPTPTVPVPPKSFNSVLGNLVLINSDIIKLFLNNSSSTLICLNSEVLTCHLWKRDVSRGKWYA